MYLQDWDGVYPLLQSCKNPNRNPVNCTPIGQLVPYLKNVQIWVCPSEGARMVRYVGVYSADYGGCAKVGRWLFPVEFVDQPMAIGINTWAPTWANCKDQVTRVYTDAKVVKPAERVFFGDQVAPIAGGPACMIFANACGVYCKPAVRDEKYTRHTGGSNLVFMDGHAKWLHWQQIYNRFKVLMRPDGYFDNADPSTWRPW